MSVRFILRRMLRLTAHLRKLELPAGALEKALRRSSIWTSGTREKWLEMRKKLKALKEKREAILLE